MKKKRPVTESGTTTPSIVNAHGAITSGFTVTAYYIGETACGIAGCAGDLDEIASESKGATRIALTSIAKRLRDLAKSTPPTREGEEG